MSEDALWWISIAGQSQGPFSREDVIQRLRLGTLTQESFICPAGSAKWQRLADLPEFAHSLTPNEEIPPPPPDEYLSKPPGWNPLTLAWLGLLFWPSWTGVMTALNTRRLGLDQPIARPLAIGVGADLLSLMVVCSGFNLEIYLDRMLFYVLPLLAIWYLDLAKQRPVYEQRKPTNHTHWMFPLLAGIPLGLLTLIAWFAILFLTPEPENIDPQTNYPPSSDGWNYSSSLAPPKKHEIESIVIWHPEKVQDETYAMATQ